jgi:hypothetical protein
MYSIGFYFICIFIRSVSLLFPLSYFNKNVVYHNSETVIHTKRRYCKGIVKDKMRDAHGNCGE